MQEIFLMEATRYQVLPLENSTLTRPISARPGPVARRRQFTHTGPVSAIPGSPAPNLPNCSYRVTADIEVPQSGANGVQAAQFALPNTLPFTVARDETFDVGLDTARRWTTGTTLRPAPSAGGSCG